MPLLEPSLPVAEAPVVKWGKLYGAAAALAIAEGAARSHAPLIVITQSSREAEALGDEIRFFSDGSAPVRVFPDLETLPYDGFSAHPDITSARLATLAELPRARQGGWLRAAMSTPTRSRFMSAKLSTSKRCARNWLWPATPLSRKSLLTANSRSAVRSSTSFPWARTLPIESTCWTAMSTASGASIRIRSAPWRSWTAFSCCPHARRR